LTRALPLALVAALGGAPIQAPAYNGPGCSAQWNLPNPQNNYVAGGSGTCPLLLQGTPIHVTGDATSLSTTASVSIHVWLTPQGSNEVVIAECQASGSHETPPCYDEVTPLVVDARLPVPPGGLYNGVALTCHFEWTGNRQGGAGCFTREACSLVDPVAMRSCLEVLGDPLP
jgi:hypothetical protein